MGFNCPKDDASFFFFDMEGLGIDCGKYDTSDCSDEDDEDRSYVGKSINTIHTSVIGNELAFGSPALPFTADTLSYHQEDNNLSGSVAIDGSIGTTTPVMEPTSDFDTNKLCLEVSKSKDVDPNARVKTYWCNGGLNQLWAVLDVKLTFYSYKLLRNPYAEMCLDLWEGKEDYGATVNLYKCDITNGPQQWDINIKGGLPDVVQISYAKDSPKWCLDAGSRDTSGSGTTLTIYPCDMNVQAQKWTQQFSGTYDKTGAKLYSFVMDPSSE